MPNKLRHDRDTSLERALALFWERGYHATSLKDLEHALDLHPGSIYQAFGSKAELFAEALDRYAQEMIEDVRTSLEESASPLAGLERYLREVARACTAPMRSGRRGDRACMLVKTILELGSQDRVLCRVANRWFDQIENLLAEVVIQAQAAGEIDRDLDPRRLARLLQAQLIGLRSFAQRQISRRAVAELCDDIITMLERMVRKPA